MIPIIKLSTLRWLLERQVTSKLFHFLVNLRHDLIDLRVRRSRDLALDDIGGIGRAIDLLVRLSICFDDLTSYFHVD